MDDSDSDSDGEIYLLGTGTWRDWLPTLPRPVFALGEKEIYRVMVHGDGFALPIGNGKCARGFFTTRYVAAATAREAKRIATAYVEADWKRLGHDDTAGSATIVIEQIAVLGDRFLLRSGGGFSFYSETDEDDDTAA
jgi:hypothetical protein